MLELPKKINIIDVTMRDGLQNEEVFVPLEGKLYIANKLIEAGIKKIEVGSLSHIKYVPQFKDIDDLLFQLPDREDIEYTVLALNKKAVERAINLKGKGARIDRVLTGQIATSEAYARKNMNRTTEELFAEAEESVKMLHTAGIHKVAANVGTIFGCPIQGEVPIEKAYEFVGRCFDIGFDEVEHSDPDGKATPTEILEYFHHTFDKYSDVNSHSFHMHDVRGTGITGYFAAMMAGITTFDVTVGGIGGQVANIVDGIPVKGTGAYYFEGRRTGLVSAEDFITMLNDMKIETGIDQHILYNLCITMEKMLGKKMDSFTSYLKETYAYCT